MVEKYNIRTDLALEEKERFESDHVEVQGVILTEEYDEENEIRITTVRIETENGAKVMGKPVGSYITIEAPEMAVPDEGYHQTPTGGSSRESSTMDASLMEQRRVSEEGFRIVKLCCKSRTSVRVESSHCDGSLPERDG